MERPVRWKLTACLLLLALVGCAAAPRAERYVAPPLGTAYVVQQQDSGSYGNGRSETINRVVERTWEGKPAVGFQNAAATLVVQPDGSWVGMVGYDGKPLATWDPPLHWDFPLEVGKRWTKAYKVHMHPQNRVVPFEVTQVVEAYEDVTVPAGTYKAFRIRSTNTLAETTVVWFSPQLGVFVKQSLERGERNPQGPGRREAELKSYTLPQRY